jgi:ferrous iron transport protein A
MSSIKLSALSPGARGRVTLVPSSAAGFVRLREMGLLAGTVVTFVRAAPLGDPLEFKLRGYLLSVRRDEADQIEVEPLVDSAA